MNCDFFKYHALGNDYIVIDPAKNNIELNKKNIVAICDRNFGVGSDGILQGPFHDQGHLWLRIFNPDGSEAEKSGNGIRIFSKYVYEHGYVKAKEFELMTKGGKVGVTILDEQADLIRVAMGKVTFQGNEIPVTGGPKEMVNVPLTVGGHTYTVTCLSIGNPHCVIPLQEISPALANEIGPLVENNPMFPNRVNMQLLKVIDRHNIQIEIWERGAGYTKASGSSSCAAASAAYKLGLAGPNLTVHMQGGTISIEILPDSTVLMTGSAEGISYGFFTSKFRASLGINP